MGSTTMTRRIEVSDGEWFEINKRLEDEVVTQAMEDNETFGDALVDYLSEHYTDGDADADE